MDEVIIHSRNLGEAKQLAMNLENAVRRTHRNCQTLISTVAAASWEGKTKDAFLSYLEIIEQYHAELNEAVKLQTTALQNLESYISQFPQDSRVKRMKNI